MRSLVVYCHPDPESFVAAIKERVVETLRDRGDEVRVTDLYAEGFDPLFSADERARHLDVGGHPDVTHHVVDLEWCEQLVLVYPTWWSGQPAMLKGWIDRVWVRGTAWELPPGSKRLHGRLRNVRRLVAVTTHGSSKTINSLQGEPGKRVVTRTLRSICHPWARARWIARYGIDTTTPAERAAFLDKVTHALR